MRKHYLDNLRVLAVLMLIPYHTFMVYNNFGDDFYVRGAEVAGTSAVIIALWPWLMPLMFTIAGISSYYALQKRTAKEYAKERISRLLIPLISGVLLLVPLQTYLAEKFHNGYSGNYFEQYVLFFTKPTDLTGNTGGFTPAQLWFILYLFVISMIALPLMVWIIKSKKLNFKNIPLPVLLLLFLIPTVLQVVLDIGGKSLGEYFSFFMLGFIVLSKDDMQEKLQKYRFLLLGLSLSCMIAYVLFHKKIEEFNFIAYEALYGFYAWVSVLAVLGLGKRYLNQSNKLSAYLSKSSFAIYIFHQQWVILAAYFALKWINGTALQMVLIIVTGYTMTFANYEAFRRLRPTRFLFGIKK